MAQQILVVDDDTLICKGLKFNLEQEGYQVLTATNSRIALDHLNNHTPDAVVLDIGLPEFDGLRLCQQIKARYHLPVIFLTARRRELDEIVGLEVGADDYITKPFNIDVFKAHLKAVLRRDSLQRTQMQRQFPQTVEVGDFKINQGTHRAYLKDKLLDLAPREFDLLYFFLTHPDHVFDTNEIIEHVWGAEFIGQPQVLYVQMRGLREKVEVEPSQPRYLNTIRGIGYQFVP